jgi:hypothetical protein
MFKLDFESLGSIRVWDQKNIPIGPSQASQRIPIPRSCDTGSDRFDQRMRYSSARPPDSAPMRSTSHASQPFSFALPRGTSPFIVTTPRGLEPAVDSLVFFHISSLTHYDTARRYLSYFTSVLLYKPPPRTKVRRLRPHFSSFLLVCFLSRPLDDQWACRATVRPAVAMAIASPPNGAIPVT